LRLKEILRLYSSVFFSILSIPKTGKIYAGNVNLKEIFPCNSYNDIYKQHTDRLIRFSI